MKPSFLIEPEAELELEDAARWYNSERHGLGNELILAVEEVFDNIRRNPKLYGTVWTISVVRERFVFPTTCSTRSKMMGLSF